MCNFYARSMAPIARNNVLENHDKLRYRSIIQHVGCPTKLQYGARSWGIYYFLSRYTQISCSCIANESIESCGANNYAMFDSGSRQQRRGCTAVQKPVFTEFGALPTSSTQPNPLQFSHPYRAGSISFYPCSLCIRHSLTIEHKGFLYRTPRSWIPLLIPRETNIGIL